MPSSKNKPLIVTSAAGGGYDLFDGHHRLSGLLKSGATHAHVVVIPREQIDGPDSWGNTGWNKKYGTQRLTHEDWIADLHHRFAPGSALARPIEEALARRAEGN